KDQNKAELKDSDKLDFQLGFAALISDAIGLIKAAAPPTASENNIREGITKGLHQYINGKKFYRGMLLDWYFTTDKILDNEAVLGWKPPYYNKPI
ncbi:hypothetical protein NL388_29705, partial [Klebsiella pneumoniae]|nr:hypothetical protein [Klebsiella pneumoniae]